MVLPRKKPRSERGLSLYAPVACSRFLNREYGVTGATPPIYPDGPGESIAVYQQHIPDPANIEQSLSRARFRTYLLAAHNDHGKALKLYEENTRVSESLYGTLQGLEVALRNAIHVQLTAKTNRSDWYDIQVGTKSLLRPDEAGQISNARKRLLDSGKHVTPDQVVATLSFGFWVALTSSPYERSLWIDKEVYKAFPNRPRLARAVAYPRLNDLRILRNRVAHHEPVFRRNIRQDLANILDSIAWICLDTAAWIFKTSTLESTLLEVGWK